jgi:hypothetical protein
MYFMFGTINFGEVDFFSATGCSWAILDGFFPLQIALFCSFWAFFLEYDRDADEGMTPRILDIGLPATAQEQDGRSKPKKPKIN